MKLLLGNKYKILTYRLSYFLIFNIHYIKFSNVTSFFFLSQYVQYNERLHIFYSLFSSILNFNSLIKNKNFKIKIIIAKGYFNIDFHYRIFLVQSSVNVKKKEKHSSLEDV